MEESDDEILMLQVREGDLDKLSQLFERYSGMLYSFFMKRSGVHTLSEDLTQEVFLRILKYRRSYHPGSSFKAWLFTIARNIQYKHWTKGKSRRNVIREEPPADERFEPIDEGIRPDDQASRSEETELLYEALEKLPEEKRQLVVMRRIQDLEYAEMARILGCETNLLKVRVHRAVVELTKQLKSLTKERSYEMPGM
ncbi:RNA polymerase sigma factor, sigma-70 family [Verrucomicrobiia bacterium DG1235]|nr:RNA polymerase sigma factor, sigma-70 family [Verrucomicrobiae bacterium DG1235]